MSLHRRGALSIVASLLTGGCLGFAGGGCEAGVNVAARQFDPIAELDGRLVERQRTVAAETVANDGSRRRTYGTAPFSEPTLVPHDGAVYRLRREPVDSVDVPAFDLSAKWLSGRTPAEREAVPFEELPANDRRAFRVAMPKRGGRFPVEGFTVDGFPAPYPDGGDGSVLIGSRTWVEWRDRTVSVEVAGEQTGTTQRVTYAFSAEQVAESEAAFRSLLAEEYLVDFSDAPAAQRELLRDAVGEDPYEACDPVPDALGALRERLADEPTLPAPYPGDWYVAFDGERYRLSVREWSDF